MAGKVNPIPENYRSAIPYLYIKGASAAIDFYKKAFGATELFRMEAPGGKIGHAEMKIGDALFMLADEYPEMNVRGPKTIGGTAVSIYVYVTNVDALAKRATEAGAIVRRPLADQFYGDRSVQFEDPFGHVWGFASHVEDVSPHELERRAKAKFAQG